MGERVSGRANIILFDYSYSVRKYRNDDHAEHAVSGSNDIKNQEKAREDFKKPKTEIHVFYSALQFDVWYKALHSKKRQEEAGTKEITRDSGSKRIKNNM